jgi:hypothetical protein
VTRAASAVFSPSFQAATAIPRLEPLQQLLNL